MHRATVLIFLTVFVFSGSLAAVCPRFSTVTNLNIPEHIGNWGIHGLIVSEGTDPKLQCLHLELTGTQFSKEPVELEASLHGTYQDSDGMVMESYKPSIPSLSRPGRWVVEVNQTTYDFSILHTDYVEYSLMALCAVVNDKEVTKVLLASRSHNQMPDNVVNSYKALLQSQNIDTTLYFPIIHDHMLCH